MMRLKTTAITMRIAIVSIPLKIMAKRPFIPAAMMMRNTRKSTRYHLLGVRLKPEIVSGCPNVGWEL